MCLLTVFPEGIQPDPDALINGAFYNDDGHGFAIVVDNKIVVRKSLSAEKLVEDFVRMRSKHPEGPAMFHSRFTTDGIQGEYNVHPFPVKGLKNTVLAHNGIMPEKLRPRKGDIRSDTRIVAENFIKRSGIPLWSRRGRRRFGRTIGLGNKVALLTLDPRFARNWYIINEHLGTWDNGIWYSNDGYMPRQFNNLNGTYVTYTSNGYRKIYVNGVLISEDRDDYGDWWTSALDRSDQDDCRLCESRNSVVPQTNFCEQCQSCQDCEESMDCCLCYTPMHLDPRIGQKAIEAGRSRLQEALDTLPDTCTG